MTAWTKDELTKIGRAEELEIASLRRDGTLRTPVIIWVVRHDDSLYVRSAVKGRNAAWFRGTQEMREGRIWAGGVENDVTFVEADHDIDDEVDAAYRAKYRRYAGSILNSVLTPQARSTTIKLVPRSARSYSNNRLVPRRQLERPNGGRSQEQLRDVPRVEAFSDGVFAFAITPLVLATRIPRPDASVAH